MKYLICVLLCMFVVGCTEKSEKMQGTRVIIKRVPCKMKLGPLTSLIEVDLNEIKNLVLDAKQLYAEIINGESTDIPPEKANPVLLVVNKQNNRFNYFQLKPNVKEIRLKSDDTKGVTLIIKNQEPLQIELWIDSPTEISFDVEFKQPENIVPK